MATSQRGNDFNNGLAAVRVRAERVAGLLSEKRVEARQLVEAARDREGEGRLFYFNKALAMLSPLKAFLPRQKRAAEASEALAAGDDAVVANLRGRESGKGRKSPVKRLLLELLIRFNALACLVAAVVAATGGNWLVCIVFLIACPTVLYCGPDIIAASEGRWKW